METNIHHDGERKKQSTDAEKANKLLKTQAYRKESNLPYDFIVNLSPGDGVDQEKFFLKKILIL